MKLWKWLWTRSDRRRVLEIAERSAPTEEDVTWLREATARDPSVEKTYGALRRWHELARRAPRPDVPTGFADQVLRRARAEQMAPEPRARWGWALAAATVVVATSVFVVGIPMRPGPGDIARSGSSGWSSRSRTDLVIRAPTLGAVEARQVFESAVRAHGGQIERLETAVVARVDRAGVAPLLRALARRASFDVVRTDAEPALPEVVQLRLELASPSSEGDRAPVR